jgi:hypothetical protein
MNTCDVLISRVYDDAGAPLSAPPASPRDGADDVWAVTAEGKAPVTAHPFTAALDVALVWASESGGEIYRRPEPDAAAELYKAAW